MRHGRLITCVAFPVLVLVASLLFAQPSDSSSTSAPVSPQPSGSAMPAKAEEDGWAQPLVLVMGALGTFVTSLAGAYEIVRRARKKEKGDLETLFGSKMEELKKEIEKLTHKEVEDLARSYAHFEHGMRMVLTKLPDSEALWEVIFNKISSDPRMRAKITEAVYLEITFDRRMLGGLRRVLLDESPVAELDPDMSPQELVKAIEEIVKSSSRPKSSRRDR